MGTLLIRHRVIPAKSVEKSLDTAGKSACATAFSQSRHGMDAFRFQHSGHFLQGGLVDLRYAAFVDAKHITDLLHRQVVGVVAVSYTHLRAHETRHDLVCRLLLE